MFEFRVTKYDPARRDAGGAYARDEWTSVGDIGRAFGGLVLTEPEYQSVEDAYADTALAFLREAGVASLGVAGLENHAAAPLPFAEGSALGLAEVGALVRRVLREEFWCRLEGAGRSSTSAGTIPCTSGCPRRAPARSGGGAAAALHDR